MKIKRFSLLAGIAALVTVGSVYATWDYITGGNIEGADTTLGVEITTKTETTGVAGALSFTETPTLTIDHAGDYVPVLDVDDDEDSDDSVLGAFKEVGQELKEAFISSKKGSKHFDFEEYLYRYSEKIEEYIMPDIESAIENFNNAMAAQETPVTPVAEAPVAVASVASSEEIECPSCHTKLAANAKFCPECGNKIEAKKPAFCTECGEPITPGSKFCSSCGTKIG